MKYVKKYRKLQKGGSAGGASMFSQIAGMLGGGEGGLTGGGDSQSGLLSGIQGMLGGSDLAGSMSSQSTGNTIDIGKSGSQFDVGSAIAGAQGIFAGEVENKNLQKTGDYTKAGDAAADTTRVISNALGGNKKINQAAGIAGDAVSGLGGEKSYGTDQYGNEIKEEKVGWATAGNSLEGAIAGANAGAKLGGPVGAAIGGAAGLIAGGAGTLIGRSKRVDEMKERAALGDQFRKSKALDAELKKGTQKRSEDLMRIGLNFDSSRAGMYALKGGKLNYLKQGGSLFKYNNGGENDPVVDSNSMWKGLMNNVKGQGFEAKYSPATNSTTKETAQRYRMPVEGMATGEATPYQWEAKLLGVEGMVGGSINTGQGIVEGDTDKIIGGLTDVATGIPLTRVAGKFLNKIPKKIIGGKKITKTVDNPHFYKIKPGTAIATNKKGGFKYLTNVPGSKVSATGPLQPDFNKNVKDAINVLNKNTPATFSKTYIKGGVDPSKVLSSGVEGYQIKQRLDKN